MLFLLSLVIHDRPVDRQFTGATHGQNVRLPDLDRVAIAIVFLIGRVDRHHHLAKLADSVAHGRCVKRERRQWVLLRRL